MPQPVNDSYDRETAEWLDVCWTGSTPSNVVQRIVCHRTELTEVLNSPWPAMASAREPVVAWTGGCLEKVKFWRKCLARVGDTFEEEVNQGMRPCTILAVDPVSGRFLYEYTMPGGTTALRTGGWEKGKYTIGGYSYKSLPKFWRRLVEEAESEMAANPQ